jgi:hypothetical protein
MTRTRPTSVSLSLAPRPESQARSAERGSKFAILDRRTDTEGPITSCFDRQLCGIRLGRRGSGTQLPRRFGLIAPHLVVFARIKQL